MHLRLTKYGQAVYQPVGQGYQVWFSQMDHEQLSGLLAVLGWSTMPHKKALEEISQGVVMSSRQFQEVI